MALHIGTLIKKRLKETGMSKSEFSRRISKTSQNVFDIFKRKSVDTSLLLKISGVLDYDFFQHYSVEHDRIQSGGKEVKGKEDVVKFLSVSELNKELKTMKGKLSKYENEVDQMKKENSYLKEINELLKKKKK